DLASLQVNIPSTTEYYNYTIPAGAATAGNTTFNAAPVAGETSTLRAYAGGVSVLANGQTSSAACMTTAPAANAAVPSVSGTAVSCATGTVNMK
ncbi:MAG: type IV pilin-like G/H family protein, partial [Dolichospermum sp.]